MRYLWPLSATSAILFLCFLFVGLERTDYEDGTGYSPFIKQYPTITLIYRNASTCGECDLRRLEDLGKAGNQEFNAFCRVRYDLDVRLCYAIYAASQTRVGERLGRNSMRDQFHGEPDGYALGLPEDAPQELVDFANRRKVCDYFREETPFPDQRERQLEVAAGIKTFCSGTDRELSYLRGKYGADPAISERLAEYDAVIESGAER